MCTISLIFQVLLVPTGAGLLTDEIEAVRAQIGGLKAALLLAKFTAAEASSARRNLDSTDSQEAPWGKSLAQHGTAFAIDRAIGEDICPQRSLCWQVCR